ncbi:MAG: glycosyltransferase family 9 protein [Chloroflexi bacterium]|nr:MAG: glycosyltransferase family 9 protein [Chloroflexota bacterium]
MPRENVLTTLAARIARVPFLLAGKRPFSPPRKILILRPCCLSQVMMATPLLAALSRAYPDAQIDWAVGTWARPAIASNPRLAELVEMGVGDIYEWGGRDIRHFVHRLRQEAYDTCFIPSRSGWLSLIAWWANIPQRVGLDVNGRGFAHTVAVPLPQEERHEAAVYLELARAVGVDTDGVGMEFYPPDTARTAVTRRLIDELDWMGDKPLIIMHPGGGENPLQADPRKQWPVERFALLGNYLVREYNAQLILVGGERDRPLAQAVAGMMHTPVTNWAGRINLGELGAVCEVADLYIGNDTGPTHIAAAVGCPTLAIFGPSDPAISGPYATKGRVAALWRDPGDAPFSWENGVTVKEARIAVADLLAHKRKSANL